MPKGILKVFLFLLNMELQKKCTFAKYSLYV